MKSLRKEAERAQSAKLHRLGAQGSLKMAEKGLHAKRKYASGGTVSDPMPGVEGSAPKARLDRPSRGAKGAKGKKGTNVNVVIMQHPPMGGAGGPPPAGPMPGPMAMPPHPPMPAPMAGPPPGPMPMPAGGPPMRKNGGAVGKFAKGGAVKKKADGGNVIPFESASSKAAKASDEKKDKALAKPERAKGGGVPKMDAGTGSGEGRLEQAEMCAKTKRAKGGRVEMTAGAGSGEGRIQKGDAQKKIGKAT